MLNTRIFLVAVAFASCTPSHAEPPPERFEHDMLARFHMHENYALYNAVERLLLRRNLDDARDMAKLIGAFPYDVGLAAWAPQIAAVRGRAADLANAPTLDDACRRAGQLAHACAACHVASKAAPEFRQPPAQPPDLATVEARMARHLWAVERIREGVVGGVDESWRTGLEVLASAPLPWPSADGERATLARRVHELAKLARQRSATDPPTARARFYGELLVTCSTCHALVATHP
jgi:hypothetical protein